MKKVHFSMVVGWLLVIFLMAGCGGNQYGDVEAVLDTEIDVMSNFISDMDNADNADAVVAAIDNYTSGMKKLIPQLQEISEKYPNIKTQGDISDELKAKLRRVDELAGQFQGTMMKASQYMMSPKVQNAWQDFGTVMRDLHDGQS